jgi:signal transduction histidine kinase
VETVDAGAEITVEDDGPGVAPALHTTVFEPFQQTSECRASPGLGIGLSLVARFAELHKGRAWVDERRGGGASFHVFLPDRRSEQPSPLARPEGVDTKVRPGDTIAV